MKLTIVVNVPDARPEMDDPHEIAEVILDEYEEFQRFNQEHHLVEFVSAEWSE